MSGNSPKGIRVKNGSYEARAMRNGVTISLYNKDLDELIRSFEIEKKRLEKESLGFGCRMTLNEWFEEWFVSVKSHKIKDTSIKPMKGMYKRSFGRYIGEMCLKDIKALDIQNVVNIMEKDGKSGKTISDALGKVRECIEFALTQKEQNAFLKMLSDSWYKELFYFMFLTGVRVGEVGALKWEDIDFEKELIHIRGSIYGLDTPEQVQLKITYGDIPVHKCRHLIERFHRKKSEFENVVIIGCDDQGVESTFDFSSIIKRIEISPNKDDNGHFNPVEVRQLLLNELRL